MADFRFLKNPISQKWVILSPKRAKRPDVARGSEPVCPFCLGHEDWQPREVYRIGGTPHRPDWEVRVVPNKFPFAPIHEVIIHSPDHHKNFGELSLEQNIKIFQTYRQRYQTHFKKGQVYIFHNHGKEGGESLPHPHTQLAVVPFKITLACERLGEPRNGKIETKYFTLFSPSTCEWPYEIWLAPKRRGTCFGEIGDLEIEDFSWVIKRLVEILTQNLGFEFPFNFYIYPGGDWYLRFLARSKSIGGFELGTGISVNTQNPEETLKIIKEGFRGA